MRVDARHQSLLNDEQIAVLELHNSPHSFSLLLVVLFVTNKHMPKNYGSNETSTTSIYFCTLTVSDRKVARFQNRELFKKDGKSQSMTNERDERE